MLPGQDKRLHLHGVNNGSGNELGWMLSPVVNADGRPYSLKTGDLLCFRQYNSGGAVGGLVAAYDDGNSAWRQADTSGSADINQFGTQNSWTSRCGDISRGGQESGLVAIGTYSDVLTTGNGQDPWDILFADISITSTDGTVTQVGLQLSGATALQNVNATSLSATVEQVPMSHRHHRGSFDPLFAADHLGTAQMELFSGGYPVWQGPLPRRIAGELAGAG